MILATTLWPQGIQPENSTEGRDGKTVLEPYLPWTAPLCEPTHPLDCRVNSNTISCYLYLKASQVLQLVWNMVTLSFKEFPPKPSIRGVNNEDKWRAILGSCSIEVYECRGKRENLQSLTLASGWKLCSHMWPEVAELRRTNVQQWLS